MLAHLSQDRQVGRDIAPLPGIGQGGAVAGVVLKAVVLRRAAEIDGRDGAADASQILDCGAPALQVDGVIGVGRPAEPRRQIGQFAVAQPVDDPRFGPVEAASPDLQAQPVCNDRPAAIEGQLARGRVVAVLGQGGLGRDRPSPAVGDRLGDDVDHARRRVAAEQGALCAIRACPDVCRRPGSACTGPTGRGW